MLSSDKPAAVRGEAERDVQSEKAKDAALSPETAKALLEDMRSAAQLIAEAGKPFDDPLDVLKGDKALR